MGKVDTFMKDREFRIHPSDEELAYFTDGVLEESRNEFIKKHLAKCSRCRSSVVGAVKQKRNIEQEKKSYTRYYIIPLAASILVLIFVPIVPQEPVVSYTKSLSGVEERYLSLFAIFIEWVKSFLQ